MALPDRLAPREVHVGAGAGRRFLVCWTRLGARVQASGVGLSGATGEGWHVRNLVADRGHVAAVAAQGSDWDAVQRPW